MADYLQRFVEDTEKLPSQLHQTLVHMRQLDEQAAALQASIDEAVRAKITAAAQKAHTAAAHRSKRTKSTPRPAAPLKMDEAMAGDCVRLQALADDKVELARRIYNFVDQRIQATDTSLKQLDSEMNRERRKLGLRESAVHMLTGGAGVLDGGGRGGVKQKKRKREAALAAAAGIAAALATPEDSPTLAPLVESSPLPPFTPGAGGAESAAAIPAATGDEPTYCYCQRVSYGDMIACDNPDCAIEWFHNVCVGLKPGFQPKGKWYCKDCAELKRAGKIS